MITGSRPAPPLPLPTISRLYASFLAFSTLSRALSREGVAGTGSTSGGVTDKVSGWTSGCVTGTALVDVGVESDGDASASTGGIGCESEEATAVRSEEREV